MNRMKLTLVLVGLVLSVCGLNAQNQSDMRLNEVLVTNTSDFQDDFGQHNAWIELFNVSYGTVNIGGCYITNDPQNLTKYSIPKGDALTKVKPRQHVLFWADGQQKRGTFHLNFTIKAGDEILFVSSDGKTILDKMIIPTNIRENTSFGRLDDGIGSTEWDSSNWIILPNTSPSTNNSTQDGETKAMKLEVQDPHGITITATSMLVVFSALLILFFIFSLVGTLAVKKIQRKSDKTVKSVDQVNMGEVTAESFAAISMALHLYVQENEAHDDESLVITLHHTDRNYSPWNSKIYGLRQTPEITPKKR